MLAYIYALITLVLIALAVIGVPNGRKALRYYLTVTTVYLNLRFDVDSGEIAKVSQCCLENTVMILAVIAGMHFMEAKELGNQEKSARRAKNITLAQIAYSRKSGKEEGLFVTPQETTRKHLENIQDMKETNKREITGKKSKKTPQQMLEALDAKAMALTGGKKIPMKPED